VVYRGPSLLDGRPIVVVATRSDDNPKVGLSVATWILCDDGENPWEARRSGADFSICGDCPHRAGSCYVNLSQGPRAVHDGLKRGIYPVFDPTDVRQRRLFAGRLLRLGSYGDPVAVPLSVWESLLPLCHGHVGYTHQWRVAPAGFRRLCMASVETPSQRLEAQALGWRTFRVRLAEEGLEAGEFTCPAAAEAGSRLQCADCRACHGATASGRGATVAILFHGSPALNGWSERVYRAALDRVRHLEEARILGRLSLPLL
jgi:hypothetical protein